VENLKLPVIKGRIGRDRRISMDDYLRFVLDNAKHSTNITSVRKLKKKSFTNVPFVLR
jgi:hypothetical protein